MLRSCGRFARAASSVPTSSASGSTPTTMAAADHEGHPSRLLFLVGPLRKGLLWENTAVPELRVEARRMAELLGGEDGGASKQAP